MPSIIQAITFLDLPGSSFERIWILLGMPTSKRRSVPSSKPQNHTHAKSRKIKVNQVYSHQNLTNYRTLLGSLALAPHTLILPHNPMPLLLTLPLSLELCTTAHPHPSAWLHTAPTPIHPTLLAWVAHSLTVAE